MLITGEKLREIAGSFLETLDREDITALNDVVEMLGERLVINENSRDYIEISKEDIKPNREVAYFLGYKLYGREHG